MLFVYKTQNGAGTEPALANAPERVSEDFLVELVTMSVFHTLKSISTI